MTLPPDEKAMKSQLRWLLAAALARAALLIAAIASVLVVWRTL